MDPEFWASRVTAAKRNASPHADQYFCMDDTEGEDATRLDFLCPYCYLDFDIASLCCHIEEEHCHETINVPCPVCSTNIGIDIVGHITRQHSHIIKTQRRRKNVRGGVRSNFRGEGSLHPDASITTADPLLSSFICGLPSMDTHEHQNTGSAVEESPAKESSDSQAIVREADSSVPDEESKQILEEGMQRAAFVQQLMLSIILPDEF